MLKRNFAMVGAAVILSAALGAHAAKAETAQQINTAVDAAIKRCHATVPGCESITSHAKGILVFPDVIKAGAGVGGSYGVGALRVNGKTVGYYSTTSASLGLQLGAEKHSELVAFLTDQTLADFRGSSGWEVGGNAAVTVFNKGTTKDIDTLTRENPIVAFVYGESGLMGSLSLEGSKITPYTPQ